MASDHRQPAGARFSERDAESLDARAVGAARHPDVCIRDVEYRRQLGLGHVPDEADVIGDVQLSGEFLILFALLAAADHEIVQVQPVVAALRHGAERHVDALVGLESSDGEHPGAAVQTVAFAYRTRVDPGPELLGIRAERHQAHRFGERIEPQLAQHLLRLLARPLAVGDDGDRGAQQCLRRLAREARVMDRVQLFQQITAVHEDAVFRSDALVHPFRGIRARPDRIAPREARLVLARERGDAARPE